jgi:hypothetical protein
MSIIEFMHNTTSKPMENKQQTAVEWLLQNIPDLGSYIPFGISMELHAKFQQAKAMVRQQIAEAYRQGVEEDVYNTPLKTGQEYYTETYGKS